MLNTMSPFLRRPIGAEAYLNVQVGGIDQIAKRYCVALAAGAQFHVPRAFATSLQQSGWVLEHCAVEEPDIDMSFECVDVSERRILHTCDGATIVHQLPDIVTALPHLQKPLFRNGPQFNRAQFNRAAG